MKPNKIPEHEFLLGLLLGVFKDKELHLCLIRKKGTLKVFRVSNLRYFFSKRNYWTGMIFLTTLLGNYEFGISRVIKSLEPYNKVKFLNERYVRQIL